jgi:hypothetical protein
MFVLPTLRLDKITLFEVGQNSGRDLVSMLGPSDERVSLWHFTSGSKVTLRAEAAPGRLIYCHSFTYGELRAAQSRISISDGRLDCH